jgi:sulfonate transport system permease protein
MSAVDTKRTTGADPIGAEPKRRLVPRWPVFEDGAWWALSALLVPAVWLLLVAMNVVSRQFLPSPLQVLATATEMLASGELLRHAGLSFLRIIVGFGVGAVIGTVLGIANGRYRPLAAVVEPLVDVLRQISPVAWIPLAILWFGLGEASKIYIIALGSFVPSFINASDGIRGVDRRLISAAQSLGASRVKLFRQVLLPATTPNIFTGLVIGMGNATRFVIAAEMTGAFAGLGFMAMRARETARTDIIFVAMIAMALVGLINNGAITLAQRRLLRWHVGSR